MLTEDLLINLLARTEIEQDVFEKIKKILKSNLNWTYFSNKAKKEGVSGLVYRSLSRIDNTRSIVPKETWKILENCHYTIAVRNNYIYQNLGDVLNSFNQAGIEAIVLKGTFLAEKIYKNIALRPMVDIDLLVHKENLPRIKKELGKLGYRVNRPDYQTSLEAFGSVLGFIKEGGILLEIHWDIAQIERFKRVVQVDNDALWEAAKTCKIADVDTLVLSPEYLILNLCIHLSLNHSFHGLIWFCDLREVLRYYKKEIDWKYIVEKAKEYKVKTVLYYCLYFFHRLLDVPLPLEVLKELEPLKIRKRLLEFFRSEDCELRGNRYIEQVLMMDKTKDFLKVLLKIVFPSKEWLRYRYSITVPRKIYLYRLLHPFMLFFSPRFHIYRAKLLC